MPRSSRPKFTKDIVNSPDFILPPISESSPKVLRYRLFTLEALPFKENIEREFLAKCNTCSYTKTVNWPINGTNLEAHYKTRHPIILDNAYNSRSSTNIENSSFNTSIDSSQSSVISSNRPSTLDRFLERESPSLYKERRNSYTLFDIPLYRDLIVKFILNNNLPLSIVDSPSFRALIVYLNNSAPNISRPTIKLELEELYNRQTTKLKARLANNDSRYSLTLDEWKSGNNNDYLAITIHFLNKDFKVEKYLIGFEYLNDSTAYTGEELYKYVDSVLKEYDIRNKVLSITRDNASPITTLIEEVQKQYKAKFNTTVIDNRCVLHIINLVTNAFLKYLFFIPDATKGFILKKNEFKTNNPTLGPFLLLIEALPSTIRHIITTFRYTHFFKNHFKRLVREGKEQNKSNIGPEVLILDNATRWLSTLNMLERFIYFKDEIEEVIRIYNANPIRQKTNKVDNLIITSEEWDYIVLVRDILEQFRAITKKLEASEYSMVSSTLPFIFKLLTRLERYTIDSSELSNIDSSNTRVESSKRPSNSININPYIKVALLEAINKLEEYYPIRDISTIKQEKLKSLYIATILDPRFKFELFQDLIFNNNYTLESNVKRMFKAEYNKYKIEYNNSNIDTIDTQIEASSSNIDITNTIDSDSDTELLGKRRIAKDKVTKDEITLYIEEDRLDLTDSISNYYNLKSTRRCFPIIYRMARDYLGIVPSSAPSEAIFSRTADIITKKRNRLLPSTIKELIILKEQGELITEDIDDNKVDFTPTTSNKKDNNSRKRSSSRDTNTRPISRSRAKGKERERVRSSSNNSRESYNPSNASNTSSTKDSNIEMQDYEPIEILD